MRDDFAFKCVQDVLNTPHVNLKGLHCHIGSQIFSLTSFREAVDVMVGLMARIEREYGIQIDELDMGGGLGIAYQAEDKPASIEDFAELVTGAVKEACEKHGVPLPRLLVEPGRSMVAPAGVTLYTVGILKTLPNIRKYVAVDGGMSDNIRTALYHASYEPVIANKAGQPRTEIVTIAGKHCESGDAVVLDGSIQHPDLGDIVCVFSTGAYCYTMASNYNGQPRPAVVFVKDGTYRVTTRRGNVRRSACTATCKRENLPDAVRRPGVRRASGLSPEDEGSPVWNFAYGFACSRQIRASCRILFASWSGLQAFVARMTSTSRAVVAPF